MNNEEKILSALDTLVLGINTLAASVNKLENGQAKLENGQAKLENGQVDTNQRLDKLAGDVLDLKQYQADLISDIADLKHRVNNVEISNISIKDDVKRTRSDISNVKIILENVIEPHIRLIAEGHTGIAQRLDYIEPLVENLAEDVAVIKAVVSSHSGKINALRESE